jgi:hypothetical protein
MSGILGQFAEIAILIYVEIRRGDWNNEVMEYRITAILE